MSATAAKPLKGRWTVFECTGCGEVTGRHKDCDAKREAVEVVPVDVERLAQHLYDTDDTRSRIEGVDGEVVTHWCQEPDGYRNMYRDRARDIFAVLAAKDYS